MHGITLLSAPADWEIVQQENGYATITLKGSFRVHPAAIEVGVKSVTPIARVMSEQDNSAVSPWTHQRGPSPPSRWDRNIPHRPTGRAWNRVTLRGEKRKLHTAAAATPP